MNLDNIAYLIATRPQATLALAASAVIIALLVAAPLLNILVPAAKMVFGVAALGLGF